MGHSKWSEIKRRKGVPDRPLYTYTVEPDGNAWLLRVVERPELVTAAAQGEMDRAGALVRDLIATVDQVSPESFDVAWAPTTP